MINEAKKLVDAANELREICVRQMCNDCILTDMTAEEFDLYKKLFNMVEVSTNLVLEQAKLFDELDKKMDKLLNKMEA